VILDDLLLFAAPLREPIRSSGRPYAHEVETRLDVSARHLSAAHLGPVLEPTWHADPERFAAVLPTDHATVTTAAQTLTFAGSMATLDLCASALLRWIDHRPRADREFDMGSLHTKCLRREGVTLPAWADDWRRRLRSDATWKALRAYRDGQLHRIVRRDSTVTIGDPPHHDVRLSADPLVRPVDRPGDLFSRVTRFTRGQWEAFWTRLAAEGGSMS
jgi:hypothetical protein